MSNPYSYFGFNLWRLREKRGKSAKEMAEYLKQHIGAGEYRRYETGERLPTDQVLLEISRVLKKDVGVFKQWAAYSSRKKEDGKAVEGATAYLNRLEKDIVALEQKYQELTGKKFDAEIKKALDKLKRKVAQIIDLPVLPMNFILIMDALGSREAKKYKYLREVSDFIISGENLAEFVARDLYLGVKTLYLANLLFSADRPFANAEECLNQMTIAQFQEILLLAVIQSGIYKTEGDIPRLQQHADFSSQGSLYLRELEKELANNPPKDIDFNHLRQAILLQGMGQYALYERLNPSIMDTGEEILEGVDDPDIYTGFNKKLFQLAVWELHPAVGAILAANWNFPKEVCDIVLTHHDHPAGKVSPTCAVLKIINFFVDSDFPTFSKSDLEELLKAHPQVTIPVEAFYEACSRMAKIKPTLYERSSTLLEQASQDVAEFATQRVKQMSRQPAQAYVTRDDHLGMPLKRSDFRFDH
jgi:transcriptional regulator with XRE-family HTH domain